MRGAAGSVRCRPPTRHFSLRRVGHRVDGYCHGQDEREVLPRCDVDAVGVPGAEPLLGHLRRSCGRPLLSRTRGRRCSRARSSRHPASRRPSSAHAVARSAPCARGPAARQRDPPQPWSPVRAGPGSGCGTGGCRGRPRGRACCAAASPCRPRGTCARHCRSGSSSRHRTRPASGASGSVGRCRRARRSHVLRGACRAGLAGPSSSPSQRNSPRDIGGDGPPRASGGWGPDPFKAGPGSRPRPSRGPLTIASPGGEAITHPG